jgi:DNA polymerase-3 subunit delta'
MEEVAYPWVRPVLARLPATVRSLPPALLLMGQAGLGKRDTALFLARAVLCETQRDALGACGQCPSCLLVAAGTHPDLRQVELEAEEETDTDAPEEATSSKKPARQISVARIRALADFVTTTAHRGGAKVVLIAPAEALHPAAANALLKILEEPPGETHFLLVSHQPERLLATIRSRCVHVPFFLPTAEEARAWLRAKGGEQSDLLLAQGGYAPLAAAQVADDETYWSRRKALLEALVRPGFNPVLAAEKAEPIDGPVAARMLARWAYDLVALQSGGTVRYHLDFREALERLARRMSQEKLLAWYDQVIQYGRVSQHPLNKRLAMEQLLAGYPAAN